MHADVTGEHRCWWLLRMAVWRWCSASLSAALIKQYQMQQVCVCLGGGVVIVFSRWAVDVCWYYVVLFAVSFMLLSLLILLLLLLLLLTDHCLWSWQTNLLFSLIIFFKHHTGFTPLQLACRGTNMTIIRSLLAHPGADPHRASPSSPSPGISG